MANRVRYIDSITEGVSRWASKRFGRSTRVSRGSVLLVNLMGALEHSGIYLGNARVAELYNNDGVGRAQIVPLGEFLYGQDGEGVRWGSCVYAACTAGEVQLADERVAKVAEKFVRERRRVDYGVFRNNCHLFSMSCIAGKYLPERDFPELLTEGTTSVGELQNMISEKLNDGDEVCWRPAKAINEILGIDNAAVNFNVPTLTGGGKSFWTTIDRWNGWKLQKNDVFGNTRILDSKNYRKAWATGFDGETALLEMMDRLRLCERIYKGRSQDII